MKHDWQIVDVGESGRVRRCRNCRVVRRILLSGGPRGGLAYEYQWADGVREKHQYYRAVPKCRGLA